MFKTEHLCTLVKQDSFTQSQNCYGVSNKVLGTVLGIGNIEYSVAERILSKEEKEFGELQSIVFFPREIYYLIIIYSYYSETCPKPEEEIFGPGTRLCSLWAFQPCSSYSLVTRLCAHRCEHWTLNICILGKKEAMAGKNGEGWARKQGVGQQDISSNLFTL